MKNKLKIGLISLGCPKNLVDSEVMLGKLAEKGYVISFDVNRSDVIIINTCAFIEEARKESCDILEKFLDGKSYQQKVIVTGCLPQLYKRRMLEKYPRVNAVLGSGDFPRIVDVIEKLYKGKDRYYEVLTPKFIQSYKDVRLVSTPPSYAYLKIAEGCSHSCSFCIIPNLRGRFRSRPINDIVKEAKQIANLGFKEIILVGQDTTSYGVDIYGKPKLSLLLRKLEEIDKIHWIRFLYSYPTAFTNDLIKTIKTSEKICHYIDIPLQHTDEEILEKMRRPSFKYTRKVIDTIRDNISDVALRSTFIIGFPGETEDRFERLCLDIGKLSLDWVGFFIFSPEQGLKTSVEPKILRSRLKKLGNIQNKITRNKNSTYIKKKYPVLVDTPRSGHTQFQTPEIDGKIVFVKPKKPGKLLKKKIIELRGWYDLVC